VPYAFGHANLGLTEAPITAKIVTAIATEKAPPIDLAAFRVERFAQVLDFVAPEIAEHPTTKGEPRDSKTYPSEIFAAGRVPR